MHKFCLHFLLSLFAVSLIGVSDCIANTPSAASIVSAEKTAFQQRVSKAQKIEVGGDVQSFTESGGRVLKGLFYCVALIFVAYSLYRRYVPSAQIASSEEIQIVSRKAVSARSALVVVEVQGRRFLLAEGQEQVTLISDLSDDLMFKSLEVESGEQDIIGDPRQEVRGRANGRA